MKDYTHIVHPFGPLYDAESTILILGSLPSVKSREQQFFYGHPQNRFWPMLAALFGEPAPRSVEEKRALALRHHVALWDTIYSCDIVGSSDSSIRNVVPTDLRPILEASKVQRIFCNGATSGRYFQKYQAKTLGLSAQVLPSTSPANAAWSFDRLLEAWRVILE
jgi:hypoxanthine-DNA glycosylase